MSSTPKKRRNTPRYLTLSRLHFAGPYFEGYVRWLQARNYTKTTISMLTIYLGHWTDWMHDAGYDLGTIHSGYAASVPAFRGKPNGLVAVWCRSFDSVMCSKGDEPWAQSGRMNFARTRCVSH